MSRPAKKRPKPARRAPAKRPKTKRRKRKPAPRRRRAARKAPSSSATSASSAVKRLSTAEQLDLPAPAPRAPDPAAQADAQFVRDKVVPKLQAGAPLSRHESAVCRRYEKARAERYRDEGLRAAPESLVETLLQTSRKVIQEWLGQGMPRSSDGSFDLFRILPWVKARWLGQTAAAPSSPEAAEARLRRDQAVARLKELELAEREGSLIPRAEAMQDRVAIVQTFTVILDRLAVDFRSAFATLDVGRQAEWLDVWQAGERERLVELGGVPTAGSTAEIAEAAEEAKP